MIDKVQGIGKKQEIYIYLKNKAKFDFLRVFLKPIIESQKHGIYLTIKGANGKRIKHKFVPYLFGFSVDSAEGYKLTGTKPGGRKCRLCESLPSDYVDFEKIELRTSAEYIKYQSLGEKAWIKKILGKNISPKLNNILLHNKKFSIMNVANPLHDHFLPSGRNLFQAVQYDMLHTLHKGLLQQVFMWTLVIVYQCSKKRFRGQLKYENNFNLLDERIKYFSVKNSIFPCEPHVFNEGVSPYMPAAKGTASAGSKGVMNATKLEAQKYLSILFQLMLSIGKSLK